MRLFPVVAFYLFGIASLPAQIEPPTRVEIDLTRQTATLIRGAHVVIESPISSGRYGHLTQPGSFTVVEKEMNHHSTIYGKIVDAGGNTVVADADVDMKVPAGARFEPAPMRYFMRFNEADGMHAGYLPGYPASHGCVRMPEDLAIAFYNAVEVGTPVTVFGQTPRTVSSGVQPQRSRQSWFSRTFGNSGSQSRVYPSQPTDPSWR